MDRRIDALLNGTPGTVIPIEPAPPRIRAATPPAGIESTFSADSSALFEAWMHWRGGKLVPKRGDMNLVSICRLMPRLTVIDVHGPDRAVFRLAGTELEQMYGQRLTGRSYIAMVPPEGQQRRGELMWLIATRPCAVVQFVRVDWASGRRGIVEIFGVPVMPDQEGGPAQILGVVSRMPQQVWGSSDTVISLRSESLRFIDIGSGVPA